LENLKQRISGLKTGGLVLSLMLACLIALSSFPIHNHEAHQSSGKHQCGACELISAVSCAQVVTDSTLPPAPPALAIAVFFAPCCPPSLTERWQPLTRAPPAV